MIRRVSQAVVVLADGVGASFLQPLIGTGEYPALDRLAAVGGPGGPRAASSVFPTTTGPAHLPFITGRFPGPCNIPGIRWFDPGRYGRHAFGSGRFRSYMGPGSYLASRDLAREVATLFELVADHACIGGHARRGVGPGRNLTRWSKAATSVLSFVSEDWTRSDRIAARRLVEAVDRGTRLVFASFYGADAAAHKWGNGPQVREGCRRIDRAIGEVLARLESNGRADQTLLLVVSDHGFSDTTAHLDLHRLVQDAIGPTLAHPQVWRGYFGGAAAAVMVSGNAMAHVYLRGAGWERSPALDPPGPEASRLLDALLREPAVDQVILRGSPTAAIVASARGRARICRHEGRILYAPEAGRDAFGYDAGLAGCRDEDGWLTATWDTDYPDAPVQILQLLASPRAGHLLVTARPGFDLRARFEKPPHRGSHGALHRLHVMTPLLSTHPLRSGPVRTADVMPTVLDALGEPVPPGLDGRSLWPDSRGDGA